jgi:hypothetical protein
MSESSGLEVGNKELEYEEITLRTNNNVEIQGDESEVEGRNSNQEDKDIRNNEDIRKST